jgi:hypothetical protein
MPVVTDTISINPYCGAGVDLTGVVVVLDMVVTDKPDSLRGRMAEIATPAGVIRHRIDAAKDHGTATSLLLLDLTRADVPIGSRVEVEPG